MCVMTAPFGITTSVLTEETPFAWWFVTRLAVDGTGVPRISTETWVTNLATAEVETNVMVTGEMSDEETVSGTTVVTMGKTMSSGAVKDLPCGMSIVVISFPC